MCGQLGWVTELLEEHSRQGEKPISKICGTYLCEYLQSKWQLAIFKINSHFMYHLQVLFCSIIQNDAGFVFDFKPTVEHVSLVFPALEAVNGKQQRLGDLWKLSLHPSPSSGSLLSYLALCTLFFGLRVQ